MIQANNNKFSFNKFYKMLKKIQLEVYENNKIIDMVENATSTDPVHLIKSLEVFRQMVNEKLTQKILDNDNLDDYNIDEEINSCDDEEVSENSGSPKKRKT